MGKISLNIIVLVSIFSGFAQDLGQKKLLSFNIYAPQLHTEKTIWVYLPPTYTLGKQNYPVLYLQDAQNLFDASRSYAGEWQVDETLDSLQLDLIVVGIEHGNEKRIDELTPYVHPEYKGGQGDAYCKFIIQTLKPYIDRNFRTFAFSTNTAIGGSSLGGLLSFYAAMKYPEVFSAALVFSPSFWYSDEVLDLAGNYEVENHTAIYMASGKMEDASTLANQERIYDTLLAKGITREQVVSKGIEGAEHNESFWKDEFPEAVQWIYSKIKSK